MSYLIKLTDGNYLCEICGCIVHGNDKSIQNHNMWHEMFKDMWENIHGPQSFPKSK